MQVVRYPTPPILIFSAFSTGKAELAISHRYPCIWVDVPFVNAATLMFCFQFCKTHFCSSSRPAYVHYTLYISFGNSTIHHPSYRFDGRRLSSGEAPPILPRHEKGIFPQGICTSRCMFSSHFLPAPRSYDTSPTIVKPHPYEGSHRSISRTLSTSPTNSKYSFHGPYERPFVLLRIRRQAQ